jgi:hypothetical protein
LIFLSQKFRSQVTVSTHWDLTNSVFFCPSILQPSSSLPIPPSSSLPSRASFTQASDSLSPSSHQAFAKHNITSAVLFLSLALRSFVPLPSRQGFCGSDLSGFSWFDFTGNSTAIYHPRSPIYIRAPTYNLVSTARLYDLVSTARLYDLVSTALCFYDLVPTAPRLYDLVSITSSLQPRLYDPHLRPPSTTPCFRLRTLDLTPTTYDPVPSFSHLRTASGFVLHITSDTTHRTRYFECDILRLSLPERLLLHDLRRL